MEARVQIDRFVVSNFRSISHCEVEFSPLTVFIGRNAAGKTSFVGAMQFVAAALQDSLQKAIRYKGGVHSILRHAAVLPASLRFAFFVSSGDGFQAEFHLELGVAEGWVLSVRREECSVLEPGGIRHHYVVEDGRVTGSAAIFPSVSVDRVFLANASGLPEFRRIFDFLAGLASCEPTLPGVHVALQQSQRLLRALDSGSADPVSLASRFRALVLHYPERLEIIHQYLRAIAPPFYRIDVVEANDTLWLRFLDKSDAGVETPFLLSQASAGLVHSADILLELFEPPKPGQSASPVVVEEPEALLHPGAIQVLRDAFIEASVFRQVIVTTHSPEFLDDGSIPAESIRVVHRDDAGTHIEPLESATQSIIRDQLYTAGQLLRQGALV